jgi:hypothetical protein
LPYKGVDRVFPVARKEILMHHRAGSPQNLAALEEV